MTTAFILQAWIDGTDEAEIRQRGTGENAVSPVPSAEPTTLCSSSGWKCH